MIKFKYKVNGVVESREFTSEAELLRFVALNRINDEDFVLLDDGEDRIVGLHGLVRRVLDIADSLDTDLCEEDEDDLPDPWGVDSIAL